MRKSKFVVVLGGFVEYEDLSVEKAVEKMATNIMNLIETFNKELEDNERDSQIEIPFVFDQLGKKETLKFCKNIDDLKNVIKELNENDDDYFYMDWTLGIALTKPIAQHSLNSILCSLTETTEFGLIRAYFPPKSMNDQSDEVSNDLIYQSYLDGEEDTGYFSSGRETGFNDDLSLKFYTPIKEFLLGE